MSVRHDVVIVGAGMIGCTIAALLAKGPQAEQFRVTLLDAAARPRYRPGADVGLRVSALSIGSAALLDNLGAWSAIESQRLCPFDHMRVWDEAENPDGPATLRFDADEFAVPHLGYIVENDLTQRALLSLLDACNVELRFDAPLAAVHARAKGHDLELEDGRNLYADLIIGADGARSRVRDCVSIDSRSREYQQTALVTHVEPTVPHASTAWQRFLRDGPIGLLPLADGRVSIVWSTAPEQAQTAAAASDDELGDILSDASDEILGELTVAGPRATFTLAAQHAEQYVRHGIALVGDAAHTVHPLAGQGANLGLSDAAALAEVIQAAQGRGEHLADLPVLRRYERARKGENALMMHFMTGLNRLFASDSVLLGELRRTGMSLFNRSGPLRQRIVGVALGADK